MTSVVMQPGTVGYDAAGFKGVHDFAPFPCDWLSLYLGFGNGVSRSTVEAAWRAGKPVMLNCEGASDAGLGGAAKGTSYATQAIQWATGLGFDFLSPIIFSFVDFSPTAAQFPAIDACHHAMVDTMESRPKGAYVPKNYGDHLINQPWWPADAPLWHWAGDHAVPTTWTWVQQLLSQKIINGVTVDQNNLIQPMNFWSGDGPDPIDPQEDDVLTDDDKAWLSTMVQTEVFTQVLGLWREQEILNTLQSGAQLALSTDETKAMVQAAVAAALAANPGTGGGNTQQEIEDACSLAIEAHILTFLKQSS